jgi:hypothetical protein
MTNRIPRTTLILVLALLAALTLAACGGEKDPTTHGESEGSYIQAGPLVYQVQISRELNPFNIEDQQYLQGLPAATPKPTASQEWFGVWLRVQNPTDQVHPRARAFRIVDTLGHVYTPIALPAANPSAYEAGNVATSKGQPVYPDPESIAGGSPTNGSMLLFKLDTSVYANRPLELQITPPDGGAPSSVVLDL